MSRKILIILFVLILMLNTITGCSSNKALVEQILDKDLLEFIYENYELATAGPIDFEEFISFVTIRRDNTDVNNDGELEILFSVYFPFVNTVYVYVFSVEQDHTIKEMFFNKNVGWYSLDYQTSYFEEYIIVDYLIKTGGSNVRTWDWEQEIIKCGEDKCASVEYLRYTTSFSFGLGGVDPVNSISVGQAEMLDRSILIRNYNYQDIDYSYINFCYDSVGGIWSGQQFRNKKEVGPTTIAEYIWNGESFDLTLERIELPQYTIERFPSENQSAFYQYLKSLVYTEDISEELLLTNYEKFFGLEKKSNEHPCSPINNYLYVPPEIIDGVFWGNQGKTFRAEIVSLKEFCRMKVWDSTNMYEIKSVSSTDVIGEFDFPCNGSFTKIFLEDIDGDDLLEVFVVTEEIKNRFMQTLRIFRVTNSLSIIAEISGYLREPNFRGIEWEKQGGNFIIYVGRPFSESNCEHEFSCYVLDEPFEKYIWDKNKQELVEQSE